MQHFHCPGCKSYLSADPPPGGGLVSCPRCQTSVWVSPQPQAEPPPTSTSALEELIKLRCPRCKTSLAVSADKMGQVGSCPSCGQRLRVPTQQPPAGALEKRPILDVLPVDTPSVHGRPVPVRPARGPLPIPRFIRTGVLIECPGCLGIHKVEWDECGDDDTKSGARTIGCRCGADFRVYLAPERRRVARCPLCRARWVVSEDHAGGTIRCPDCQEAIAVPESPIRVSRLSSEPSPQEQLAAYLQSYAPPPPAPHYGPRQCLICGRYLRNPSSYCYRCQRRW